MATKTITIDMRAYRKLKAVRTAGESFSRVIDRVVPGPHDAEDFLRRAKKYRLSEAAAEAIEEHMRLRHAPSTRRG